MRRKIITQLGIYLFVVGALLRLLARWLAWPGQWTYQGPRENTEWAIQEVSYQHLSFFIMALASLIIAVAAYDWLKSEK
jgi:hypothetical protein